MIGEIFAAASAALRSAASDSESWGWTQRSPSGRRCRQKEKMNHVRADWCLFSAHVCVSHTGTASVCSLLRPTVWVGPQRWCCLSSPNGLHHLRSDNWAAGGQSSSFKGKETDQHHILIDRHAHFTSISHVQITQTVQTTNTQWSVMSVHFDLTWNDCDASENS